MITPRLLTTIFMFTTFFSYSQRLEWERSYGGKHSDYLFDAIATPDYGFILAGSSLSEKTGNKTDSNRGDLDFWIWKMDEHGQLDWQRSFGGSGMDLLQCVRLTADGGYLLGGTSYSDKTGDKKDPSLGNGDYWIIKLDAKGNEQWQKTLGGSGQDSLHQLLLTKDGGYLLGGSSSSDVTTDAAYSKQRNSFGNLDYWLVQLDQEGKEVWQYTYGGTYSDQLRAIEATADGGYLIGGYSNSPESGAKSEKQYGLGDYWVLKLDKEGKEEWQKVYGSEGDDQLYAITATNDGHYVLAGNSSGGSMGNKTASNRSGTDYWLVKIDITGHIVWQNTYNVGKLDILSSLIENADGSLVIGGHSQSEVMGTRKRDQEDINDYVIIKLDAEGEELWRKSVGSNDEDILKKVIELRDGGYLLAGTSKGTPTRDRKSGKGSNDFWVVKLKDEQKPDKEKASIEAVPNPTAQFTNVLVGYDYEKGTARVFDIAGRQLQLFEVTDRMIPVDLSGLPQGIYLIEIATEVQTDAVKVMKMKG
jgi:hypothetical protein